MEVGIGRGYELVCVGWCDTLGFGGRSGTDLFRLIDLIARQDGRFLECIRAGFRGLRWL